MVSHQRGHLSRQQQFLFFNVALLMLKITISFLDIKYAIYLSLELSQVLL